jgi:4-hydroxy-4-methyl-2-oxoglutarate aldolase
MFVVSEMPLQLDKALVNDLSRVETATIGHFRYAGFMDPGLRAVIEGRRVAGPAVTVRAPAMDGTAVNYALGMVRPGDFLVVDRSGDTRIAIWGGVTVYAAREAGLAGIVIDGVATDFAEVRAAGVPLWCRGPSPITTRRLGIAGEINVPVTCAGVVVRPGDVVLADDSGIVVLDPADAPAVTERALAMQEAEKETLARLEAGEKLPDITGSRQLVDEALARQSGAAR